MAIEEKLDQIIEMLKDISSKMSLAESDIGPLQSYKVPKKTYSKPKPKPTATQIKVQQAVEWMIRAERKDFLKSLKMFHKESFEMHGGNLDKMARTFESKTLTTCVELTKPKSEFYRQLKNNVEVFSHGVSIEGRELTRKLNLKYK